MRSFSTQTENVIASEIEKFKVLGLDTEQIEISEEDGIYETIESYLGLDRQDALLNDVFIEDIFTEKLPNLNRRSAFQTIYSTYEVEFQKLCRNYQKAKLGGKKFDNFNGTGFVKVSNFIECHFPQLSGSPEQELIDNLRKLRNQCIHYDAKAYKHNKKPVVEVHALITENSKLIHLDGAILTDVYPDGSNKRAGECVVFEKGSLDFFIEVFEKYAEIIVSEYQKRI